MAVLSVFFGCCYFHCSAQVLVSISFACVKSPDMVHLQIRSQLAVEFIEDLRDVSEENSTLLRESLVTSLSMSFDSLPVAEKDSSVSADSKDRSSSV